MYYIGSTEPYPADDEKDTEKLMNQQLNEGIRSNRKKASSTKTNNNNRDDNTSQKPKKKKRSLLLGNSNVGSEHQKEAVDDVYLQKKAFLEQVHTTWIILYLS